MDLIYFSFLLLFLCCFYQQDKGTYIITFNSNDTYTAGYSASYTLSGNTLTLYAPAGVEGSEAFTITNITNNFLDLKRTDGTMTKIKNFIKP